MSTHDEMSEEAREFEEFKLEQQNFVNNPVVDEAKIEDIRNRIAAKANKWADKIIVSQYRASSIFSNRKEGEVWKDEYGKTWTKENGTIRKESVHQDARVPWWCPKCNKTMNHRFDTKFYYIRGHCYDCNIAFEHELRMAGKWEEFERRTLRENEKSFLKDKVQERLEYIRTFTEPTLYFENGSYERLAKIKDFEPMFAILLRDVEILLSRLEVIETEELTELEIEEGKILSEK